MFPGEHNIFPFNAVLRRTRMIGPEVYGRDVYNVFNPNTHFDCGPVAKDRSCGARLDR